MGDDWEIPVPMWEMTGWVGGDLKMKGNEDKLKGEQSFLAVDFVFGRFCGLQQNILSIHVEHVTSSYGADEASHIILDTSFLS